MPNRRIGLQEGSTSRGPQRTRIKNPGVAEQVDEVLGWCPLARCDEFYDFNGAAFLTTGALALRDVSPAGAPSSGVAADLANGVFLATLSATSEVSCIGLDYGDQRNIPANKRPVYMARVQVSALAANERIVFGLASDYNATLDSVTMHAWFRCNASLDLLIETDDNVTDNAAVDTGIDLVADTWVTLAIDCTDPYAIRFYVDGALAGTLAAGAFDATTLQPVIWLQKDSGTNQRYFRADFIRATWDRL